MIDILIELLESWPRSEISKPYQASGFYPLRNQQTKPDTFPLALW